MPDDFKPDRGAILSFLESLGRPGQAIKNTVKGRLGSAGRQLGQLGMDLVDAGLPGDWLPNDFASAEDDISGAEVIGLEDKGFLNKTAGFGVDLVTDPLTWIPGGVAVKGLKGAAKVATKGAEKVVGKEAVEAAGRNVRKTLSMQKFADPKNAKIADDARALQSGVTSAGLKSLEQTFKGLSREDREILGEIGHNIRREGGKAVGPIDPTDALPMSQRAELRLQGMDPARAEKLRRVSAEMEGFGKRQFESGRDELDIFKDGEGVESYFPRQFSGVKTGDVVEDAYGRPSAVKGRKLGGAQDVTSFLSENPGVGLEFDAFKALGNRANQQGSLEAKAAVGKGVAGPAFKYADATEKANAGKLLKEMQKTAPEDAQVLGDLFEGLPGRGSVMNVLAKVNRVFKPAVTTGILLPRLSFSVRNALSGQIQVLSNAEARGHIGQTVKQIIPNILRAIDDGVEHITGKRFAGNDLAEVDKALRESGGVFSQALTKVKSPTMRAAMQRGLFGNNFVTVEDLATATAGSGPKAWLKRWAEMPAVLSRGGEQRLRYGLFKSMVDDAVKAGKSLDQAADDAIRVTNDTFFDYAQTSAANRAMRDTFSFATFPTKAIPQAVKAGAENPWAVSALSHGMDALSGDGSTTPSWMDNKLNIPIGEGEDGNQEYVTNLGLPFESLGMIPNLSGDLSSIGRDLRRGVVSQANPIVKTAYGALTGEDPYFESSFGSYSKIPTYGEAGDIGQAYNVAAGTGLIQPIDSALKLIDKATDSRKGGLAKALDLGLGAGVVSVDEDQALAQRLQQELASNPDVGKFESYFDAENDPEIKALIKAYLEAKKRGKAKRSAASDR